MTRRSLQRLCKLPSPVSAALQAVGEVASQAREATDKAVHSALSSPVVPFLGADSAAWQESYAQSKKKAAKSLESGLNESLQNLKIPLHVQYINGHKVESLAEVPEAELRRRLVALEADRQRIEKYLDAKAASERAAQRRPGIPNVPSTYSHDGATVRLPNAVFNTADGIETFEDGPLVRRLRYWETIRAQADVPYGMLSNFQLYPKWMPWCTAGNVLHRAPDGLVTKASVEFGVKLGSLPTFGDCIEYEVELEPPQSPHSSCRVYTASRTSKYAQKLVFDWRFIPVEGQSECTKVIFDLEYIGLATWCMPMWEAVRGEVVRGMATSFRKRLVELSPASESSASKLVGAPKISNVLRGPFLKEQVPLVVTESDGGTIRHANPAFAKLVGRPQQALLGKSLSDVLKGPGVARDGPPSGFLSRLRDAFQESKDQAANGLMHPIHLNPAVDDEQSTDGVFWGIVPE